MKCACGGTAAWCDACVVPAARQTAELAAEVERLKAQLRQARSQVRDRDTRISVLERALSGSDTDEFDPCKQQGDGAIALEAATDQHIEAVEDALGLPFTVGRVIRHYGGGSAPPALEHAPARALPEGEEEER